MFTIRKSAKYGCAVLLSLLSVNAIANTKNNSSSFDIPTTKETIVVDGNIDEPLWQNALTIPLKTVNSPWNNKPSPVATTAKVIENGEFIYISFIAHDPNPEEIRSFLGDRDTRRSDDIVGIKLDTFNNRRLNYEFLVNPLGVQHDAIANELTGDHNSAWDAIWQSYGKITKDGYQVEIAIPYRILNFDNSNSIKTWAFELIRLYPRDARLRISHIDIDRNNDCWLCQVPEAKGFKNAQTGKNVMITPSMVAQQNQTREVFEPSSNWQKDSDVDIGADLRWGINANTLLNMTINPDFSTVESDSGQLSINKTFSLFYDEKRSFFLENSDYFTSNFDLVYTRNIADPDYGAKLTGSQDNHNYGVFMTNDTQTNILTPGNVGSDIASLGVESKSAALKYRYDVNEDLSIGAISTLRTADNYHNYVYGLDTKYRINESNSVLAQTLVSDTKYPNDLASKMYGEQAIRTNKSEGFTDQAYKLQFKHASEYWNISADHESIGEDFRADLGYMPVVDIEKNKFLVDRMFYGNDDSIWQEARLSGQWQTKHNQQGELLSKSIAMSAGIDGPMLSYLDFFYEINDTVGLRKDEKSLRIDNNTDRFTEKLVNIYGNINPFNELELELLLTFGDKIDYNNNRLGEYEELFAGIIWNANTHLQLDFRYTHGQLDAQSDYVYKVDLTELRLSYQFNVNSYLKLNLIHSDIDQNPYNNPNRSVSNTNKDLSTQLIYAYKLNPQTVFYLGYSDYSLQDDDLSSLTRSEKTFFTKISYAWLQ